MLLSRKDLETLNPCGFTGSRLRIPNRRKQVKLATLLKVFAKVRSQRRTALADHVGENPVET